MLINAIVFSYISVFHLKLIIKVRCYTELPLQKVVYSQHYHDFVNEKLRNLRDSYLSLLPSLNC